MVLVRILTLFCIVITITLSGMQAHRLTKKCGCHKEDVIDDEYGYYGIYSESEDIIDRIPKLCMNTWITMSMLRDCWRSIYQKESPVSNMTIKEEITTKEGFWKMYGFHLKSSTLPELKNAYTYPCTFITTLDCYSPHLDNSSGIELSLLSLSKIANQESTNANNTGENKTEKSDEFIFHKTTTNIANTDRLFDEKGPATLPNHGIYLYGYYHAAEKDTLSFYYLTLKENHTYSSTCKCNLMGWSSEVFYYKRYKCVIPKEGCKIKFGKTSIEVTGEEGSNHCTDPHTFVRARYPRRTSNMDKHQAETYIICTNGTIMEEDNQKFREILKYKNNKCESWSIIDIYEQCISPIQNHECKIGSLETKDDGSQEVGVKMDHSGFINVKNNLYSEKIGCADNCLIKFDKMADWYLITCPSGHSREYILNKGSINCPWIDKILPDGVSVYICRITYHPSIFFCLIILICCFKWLPGLTYLVVDSLLYGCYRIYRIIKKKKSFNFEPCLCDCCEEVVDCSTLSTRHESCCSEICPYCRRNFKNFKEHVKECSLKQSVINKSKEADEKTVENSNIISRYLRGYWMRDQWKSRMPKVVYGLIIIVLLLVTMSPVHASFENSGNSLREWDHHMEDIDGCQEDCFHSGESCCENRNMYMLSSIRKHKKVKTEFVYMPNIAHNTTMFPVESTRNIDLTFNSRSEAAGKVIISGKSDIVIEVEENAGITWNIGNKESAEHVKLSVSIKNHWQKYKLKFNSWMVDRRVSMGSDNTCTGRCDENCGCRSKTCRIYKVENARGWSCNPTWCWGIGTGCSCCYLNADASGIKYLVAEFEIDYLDSALGICVGLNSEEYKCKQFSHSDVFKVGFVTLKASKVYNVRRALGGKIYLIYNVHDKQFNIKHPDKVLVNTEVCSSSNCRHGEVGDFRFFNISNLLFEGEGKGNSEDVEMIWSGVQQSMDCVSFHWPDCNAEGLVKETTHMFKNFIETSKAVEDDYKLLEASVELDKDLMPGLNLAISPKEKAGMIQIFLSVDGLRLNKMSKKITIKHFNVKKCSGCKNCYKGFQCIVDISISEPEEAYLHVKISDSNVANGEQSLVATKSIKTYNLTFFSPTDINNINICIEETNDCKSIKDVKLDIPTGKLINEGSFYSLKTKDIGNFSLSGIGSYLSNYFSKLWDFIQYLFKSWWFYLFILIVFLITFGFAIIRFFFGINKYTVRKKSFKKLE